MTETKRQIESRISGPGLGVGGSRVLGYRSLIGGLSILFVDRSVDERELFSERFGADCSRLTIVKSTDEALDVLAREEIELLITEVRLPGVDGFELVRRMRKLPARQAGAIPAIAVTTKSGAGNGARLLQCGFAGFVFKPYESSALMAAVADASTEIAVLRRLRARYWDRPTTQHELGRRLGRQVSNPGAKELYGMAKHVNDIDLVTKELVLSTASRFAEDVLARAVDDLAIGSALLLDTERESWVVCARSGGELLFVEVILGPGEQVVARRLDTLDE